MEEARYSDWLDRRRTHLRTRKRNIDLENIIDAYERDRVQLPLARPGEMEAVSQRTKSIHACTDHAVLCNTSDLRTRLRLRIWWRVGPGGPDDRGGQRLYSGSIHAMGHLRRVGDGQYFLLHQAPQCRAEGVPMTSLPTLDAPGIPGTHWTPRWSRR
jgi:hypothetical protein